MRISKNFYDPIGENRYKGKSIGDTSFHRKIIQIVSEKEFFSIYNSNLKDREQILLTSQEFIRVDDPRSFHIPFEFPEDMIQYTECFYYMAITDAQKVSDNYYRIVVQGVVTLIFDGPDELGLIWKLSI